MREAVILEAVRTPTGKRHGRLSGWHPVDLSAAVLKALVERSNIEPAQVEDVIWGCVMQVGDQGMNVGRNAVLAAGWPETVPGATLDRQCGSSQQAVHFAAQGVMSGAYDLVVAGGVEVMSTTPLGASFLPGSDPMGPSVKARYAQVVHDEFTGLQPQGVGAELIARQWGLDREAMDEFGARSQQLAAAATAEGRFAREIVPLVSRIRDRETGKLLESKEVICKDEGIRPDTTTETLARLKPAFIPDGRITAGTSSQISDGAAALLIATPEKANELGLAPRARLAGFAVCGSDPVTMLTGPIPATHKLLKRTGRLLEEIDLFEVNEAFASVPMAWAKDVGADMNKVNVNGGAIALGHPLGGSGAKLMTTLLHELERTGGRWGLQTMCEGGGMANATLLERL